MKKFILTLSIFFASISFAADGPFTIFYGIKTENPLQVLAATDELWKNCDKGDIVVSLNSDAINGENETTHTFVVNFPNNAAFAKWNKLFETCPGAAKYFETTNPIADNTNQIMGLPLRAEGDTADSKYFQVFIAAVSRPDKFIKAYDQLMESVEDCDSSGLIAFGPGFTVENGSHLAYCGFKDLESYMDQIQVREPTKEFAKFLRKTFRYTEFKAVNMVEVVKRY